MSMILRRVATVVGVAGLILLISGHWLFPSRSLPSARAVTSASCRDCHAAEYQSWAASHHALAERSIDVINDRAAFEPAHVFKAGSKTNQARFYDGRFELLTMGVDTNIEPYQVRRVIGVEPVRQFLTATGGGRWQVQEDSYDPAKNQWFDVFGHDDRQPGEWGFWTGRGMNWNSMCAECHNTRLQKNYDDATDSYHTAMDEMGVGCGACHAGMNEHDAWQRAHPGSKEKDPALAKPSPPQVLETCGACHSRRQDMTGHFEPGQSYFDEYQMEIPDDSDTWYADGQVHGEDYELASFLGSKMAQRGVICIDCHDPHSAKTILPGNNLCLRCHNGSFSNAPVIDPVAHSHHGPASTGNQCTACHMPVTVYMQRHARHDHGFTIPDPLLTKELGLPNACNRCHTDQSAGWAAASAAKWYGKKMERPTRDRARWIAAAQKGQEGARAHLIDMLSPARETFFWRAVAAGLLWQWHDDAAVKAALVAALKDPHPLVRERSVMALALAADSDDEATLSALHPLLHDPSRNVRVAAAWAFRASLDTNTTAGAEILTMLNYNADQPAGRYRLAQFDLGRHDYDQALVELRQAVAWDPYSPPFRFDLSDILMMRGQTNEAIHQLAEICRLQPASAEAQFKLGLTLADAGEIESAVAAFTRATRLDPQNTRAWYNLGLSAIAVGQVEESLKALDRAAALAPDDPQIPYERARTLARAHRYDEARAACRKALKLQAGFKPAQDLLDALPEK